MSKKDSLNKLLDYRDQIEEILININTILQQDFDSEHSVAYQHWLPQIKTALRDDTKWLSRGEYSMDYTLKRIIDQINGSLDKGVSKYIK